MARTGARGRRIVGTCVLGVAAAVLAAVAGCGSSSEGDASVAADEGASAVTTAAADNTTTATTAEPTTTTTTPAEVRAGRPYAVTQVIETFVDDSRQTSVQGGEPIQGRTLETWLWLPEVEGPVPLIVFSHGMSGHPRKFEDLNGAWASAGYAVAAITFPRTSDATEESQRWAGDLVNQPGDVEFVLDQLLAGPYADRFDTSRLAAAGLSLGGLTTYQVAIDQTTGDPRFIAAVVLAGVSPGEQFVARDMPVFLGHGERDPVIAVASARAAYEQLTGPRFFLTALGGGHADPFEDPEDGVDGSRFHPSVEQGTTAFWDRYLLGDTTVDADAIAAASAADVVTFEADAGT